MTNVSVTRDLSGGSFCEWMVTIVNNGKRYQTLDMFGKQTEWFMEIDVQVNWHNRLVLKRHWFF